MKVICPAGLGNTMLLVIFQCIRGRAFSSSILPIGGVFLMRDRPGPRVRHALIMWFPLASLKFVAEKMGPQGGHFC